MQTQSSHPQGVHIVPQTWYGRLFALVATGGLLVVGFFFFIFFLIVASAAAAVVVGRLFWLQRKLRQQASKDVIEGEFSVEEGYERLSASTRQVPDEQRDR